MSSYTKIVASSDGGSYFDEMDFSSVPDIASSLVPTHDCVSWEINQAPSGRFIDYHTTKVPKLLIVLEGALQIGTTTGEVRQFRPGDVLHATDTTGKGHTAALVGDIICRVLTVTMECE